MKLIFNYTFLPSPREVIPHQPKYTSQWNASGSNKGEIMQKIADILHWIGFLGTCFMLVLSFLDESRDELIIHLIASMIPNTLSWFIASLLAGKRKFLPFLNKWHLWKFQIKWNASGSNKGVNNEKDISNSIICI